MFNWVKIKFVAMNLTKLASWLWEEKLSPLTLILFGLCMPETWLMLNVYPVFSID